MFIELCINILFRYIDLKHKVQDFRFLTCLELSTCLRFRFKILHYIQTLTFLSTAARYLSGACADATTWATSVPTSSEFVIPPEEYRWLTAMHLQLPVPGHDLIGTSCTDERIVI